ncbi:hypothetical protein OHA21_45535 [Actinoplanes sp. NBC_00393]|uniref:hypothetical protein n=1 Tax=Actinoplanes sp. NBC_00393 TaxID=2975953 RepID=UPI002E24F743
MDRTAVDTSSEPVVSGVAEEGSAGASPLPKRTPQASRAAEVPSDTSVNWFGDTPPSAEPTPTPTPAPAPASSPPAFGPASPAGPGRASFGFSDGPIGGLRNPARSATESGELPVVQVDASATPPADPAPEPTPWIPVPFEPAAPRAATVDGWATPAVAALWPGGDTGPSEPTVWSDTPAAAPPPRRRQSRLVSFGMALLGTVALAALALTGFVYYTGPDTELSQMLQLGKNDERTVSGALDGRTVATFELLAATDRVRLSVADLGTDLYRISAPDGAGIRPNPELREDRLTLDLARDQAGTGGEIEVVLAATVRWTLRFSGYAAERVLDLSNGRVTRIELVGGTRRAEMTLAEAAGTVPMKITGGIEELVLRAPADNPIRVRVGGGAATVTAGSRTLRDLPPGSTLTPKDWQKANRYDVDAVSAITQLTVEQS